LSLQAASPETFAYTLVNNTDSMDSGVVPKRYNSNSLVIRVECKHGNSTKARVKLPLCLTKYCATKTNLL